MGITVGIDLGTTYSVAAYIDPATKKPVVLKNAYGFNTTPSVICFAPDGTYTIGMDAKNSSEAGDPNAAAFYKLEMGNKFYHFSSFGNDYTAADLSALFLKEFISQVKAASGLDIEKAVITVPAYFEDLERNNTMNAGEAAGLKVLNIINEPTAAAIAYGLRSNDNYRNILIYDLGGGTFDVTAAEITGDNIRVLGTNGRHFLGGKNWDEAICNWLVEKFYDEFGESFDEDKDTYNLYMVKAEQAKRQLTSAPYVDISVSYEGNTGRYRLTEQEFRDCTVDLLDVTKNTIAELFRDTGLSWNKIDGVILVGGSTKMKMVRDYVLEMTGREPLGGVHPDEAVAIGAAIQGSIDEYCGNGESLGFLRGGLKEYHMESLPGAKFISDVIAHSLGMVSVSADNQRFINDVMIRKNTPINQASVTKRRELTVRLNEDLNELEIYLLQGDAPAPLDCTIAKKYVFSNIAFVDGGKSKIDITYSYTLNGTIDIKAVQTETMRPLSCREEPVPEDMSWLALSPEEYYRSTAIPVEGALYMALDLSGSMSGDPLSKAKAAMIKFVDQFDLKNIKIGIVGFSDRVKVYTEATSNRKRILKAIDQMSIGKVLGYCNAAEPLSDMLARLKKFTGQPFVYAIVLTDGMWEKKACTKALSLKNDYIKRQLEIVGLGFGSADKKFLTQLSTREDLASVDDINNLESNLSKIARVINEAQI